jgi:glycosyltransferase involved in cell wall biosynthesis
LLASALASRGLRVALVVLPLRDPIVPELPRLTILQRARHAGRRGAAGQLLEGERMWRALHRADARVYVVRTGTPAVGLAALFCSARRRAFVFSSAGTNDFTFEDFATTPLRLKLYRFGVRAAQAVVVQTREQIRLAHEAFPGLRRIDEIPSFFEPPEPGAAEPEAFVWIARLVPHKGPLEYVALAKALPEARFRMIAVEGNKTPPSLAADLRAAAARVPNLELLGPRSHVETGEVLARAVASVNTAEYEGMPNVFLEAWARGVPALSLNVDPDGCIAEHGLGVAANGSWERFVAGARELWDGRRDRSPLSQRTRTYVQTVHSPDVVGARWQALVEELARARPRRWPLRPSRARTAAGASPSRR